MVILGDPLHLLQRIQLDRQIDSCEHPFLHKIMVQNPAIREIVGAVRFWILSYWLEQWEALQRRRGEY